MNTASVPFVVGDKVIVTSGRLFGLRGIVIMTDKKETLVWDETKRTAHTLPTTNIWWTIN